jgi:DNA polymerase III alpha subunit
MEASRAVLECLARIEALDRAGARRDVLVEALRALLVEAETWVNQEGGAAGARAVADLRAALARDMIER